MNTLTFFSPNAQAVGVSTLAQALDCHLSGNWGKTGKQQRLKNETVLQEAGHAVVRTYHTVKGSNRKQRFKIITLSAEGITLVLNRNEKFTLTSNGPVFEEVA